MTNKIEIKETVLGTHYWSNCPFEEVAFLRNEHHHDFTIRISCDVEHDDRDIEFIMVRIWLKKFIKSEFEIKDEIVRFGPRSCEMISESIYSELFHEFGDKNWKVNVSEDEVYRGGDW